MPITQFLIPPELSFVETVPYTSLATSTGTANQAYGVRLPKRNTPIRLVNAKVLIGAASGNIDIGIYTSTDGATFTKVDSTGSTASAGSNALQTIAFALGTYVYDGRTDVWLWFAADNGTVSIARSTSVGAAAAIGGRIAGKTTAFPLASSIVANTTSGGVPWIYAGA